MKPPGRMASLTLDRSTKDWVVFSSLLVLIYLAVTAIAWDRTLIPDEIRPLLLAAGPVSELLQFARADLIQTPLSYLICALWMRLFGDSDLVVKTLAFLIGAVTLVLFTFWAKIVTQHWRYAALLFALMYFTVGSAPNLVRMYGLAILLSVLAILTWDRWRSRPAPGFPGAWLVVMVLLFYTHGSGLLLLPPFVVITWLWGPRSKKAQVRFHLAALLGVLMLVPWVAYVFPTYLERGLDPNVQSSGSNPTYALGRLPFYFLSGIDSGGGSPSHTLHRLSLSGALRWAARLAHLVLFASAWPILKRVWPPRPRGTDDASWAGICLCCCLLPVLVMYSFSLIVTPSMHPRYFMVIMPFYFVLLTLLGFGGRGWNKAVLIMVVIPWFSVTAGLALSVHMRSLLVSEAVEIVDRNWQSGDLVLATRYMPLGWQLEWEWSHRRRRKEPALVLKSELPAFIEDRFPGEDLDELRLRATRRIWLFHQRRKKDHSIMDRLESHGYRATSEVQGADFWLTVFSKAPGSTPDAAD